MTERRRQVDWNATNGGKIDAGKQFRVASRLETLSGEDVSASDRINAVSVDRK